MLDIVNENLTDNDSLNWSMYNDMAQYTLQLRFNPLYL